MKQIFLILTILLLAQIGYATDTVISPPPAGTNTELGTQTPEVPYIQSITLLPKEVIIPVGETVIFLTTVNWSNNSTGTGKVRYICDKGTIDNRGNFMATQTGTAIITANINGMIDTAKVTLLPDKMVKFAFSITEPRIIYGRVYDKNLFVFKGLDKYNNEVPIEKVKYELRRKGITHLSQWVGETILPITEILKAGVIRDNGNMLFFDVGEYELNVIIDNSISTQFSFQTVLDGFKDISPWKDYRIIDIDFDYGKYIVEYAFIGVPAILSHFIVKDEWLKVFKEGSFMQKIQVLTWVHYNILTERQRLLKDVEYQQFKNLLLKPLEGKF